MRAWTLSHTVALAAALMVSAAAAPAFAKCSAASLQGEWRITGDWGWTSFPGGSPPPSNPPVRCDVRFNTKGKETQSKCHAVTDFSVWTLTPDLRVNGQCKISGSVVFESDSHSPHYQSARFSAKVEGWIMESGDEMILLLHRRGPGDDEVSEVSELMGYRRP